ncbi:MULTISPECIES: TIR domain-containing protein [Streptomyces]|uniref:Putative nucleotide-binding protein n=1 Tax=Streptomyces stelliscabiei TaxID=146820 RepID=A0A8I0TQL3_9ACTN|nr:nucleotide-binding protein [Streptomyces stelliscabiei]MBE1596734.1 putative nucleotide-binding protein [Streptomyces stelliscabiei]MDX2514540.1 nucleotide-binding protein [Streptomyces stelliscabiei]MDX2551241.1 nucleotide-binding protein [Streptomyces stelliscabiei]MDX2615293.1 nucleotide-binding protein [Streptomyces stelliscabiei]MDX2633901.1 nucleotide-binding protein [Streptomyces stelliscabiei]
MTMAPFLHVLLLDERGVVRSMAANLSEREVADFVRQVGRCKPFQFKAAVINPLEARTIQVRQTDRPTSDMLEAARAARRLVPADDVNADASDEIRAALMGREVTDRHISQEAQSRSPAKPDPSIGVFIVHGHEELALKTVERILTQDFGVAVRILKEQAGGGMTLIEKFEHAATEVDYAIVLLTADDFVRNGDEEYWQPRPNVLFELGWFCGRLGRDRVCLLAQRGLRILSDMRGVICHEFTNDVAECTLPLLRELKAAKYVD